MIHLSPFLRRMVCYWENKSCTRAVALVFFIFVRNSPSMIFSSLKRVTTNFDTLARPSRKARTSILLIVSYEVAILIKPESIEDSIKSTSTQYLISTGTTNSTSVASPATLTRERLNFVLVLVRLSYKRSDRGRISVSKTMVFDGQTKRRN